MCQGTGVCVVSISYGVVYGGAYLWLECCLHGCLGCPGRVCSGVCARSVRWSQVGICLVGVPLVGSLCVGMRRGVK